MQIAKKDLVAIVNILKKHDANLEKTTPRALTIDALMEIINNYLKTAQDTVSELFADTPYLDILNQMAEENSEELDENGNPVDLMSRKAMEIVAKEMNEVMCLEPGINLQADDEVLKEQFHTAAGYINSDDNFSEYAYKVFAAYGLEQPQETKQAKKKKSDKPAGKEKAAKKEKPVKEAKQKGPGVINTIAAFVREVYESDDKVINPLPLLAHLIETFPDRPKLSLMNTINTQIPGKLTKDRGFVFEKVENGDVKIVKIPEK